MTEPSTSSVRPSVPESPPRSPETLPCLAPGTGASLGRVPATPVAEIRETVARARAAQRIWRERTFAERRRVLQQLLDRLIEATDELCGWVVEDTGKTWEHAILGEIWPVAEKLRWTLGTGWKHLRPETVSSGLFPHKRARIVYEPLGVIGQIVPWNYPLQNMLGAAVPALMAGNGVVTKPSEHVAWSSAKLGAFVDEVLTEAGAPAGLFQLVQGAGREGAALVGAGVDLVVFIGSPENGRRVLEKAAESLTPVVLELGGKDPLVVCDDAELEQAAHAAMAGAFINNGQNCLAVERVLVMPAVYEAFVHRMTELAGALRHGAAPAGPGAVDVGAMVLDAQVDKVEALVQDAVAKGARRLVGGERPPGREGGRFFPPTVLADVTPEMRIAREETFGPVLVVMPVRDDAHAIEVANGTAFALSATIMTTSPERARRLAAGIRSGSVAWNDFGLTYMAMDLPFGGVDGSGFGRLNGAEGIRGMTNRRAVLEDRLPLRVPAKVFPVDEGTYTRTKETLRAIYGRGLRTRLAGLSGLIGGAAGRRQPAASVPGDPEGDRG